MARIVVICTPLLGSGSTFLFFLFRRVLENSECGDLLSFFADSLLFHLVDLRLPPNLMSLKKSLSQTKYSLILV